MELKYISWSSRYRTLDAKARSNSIGTCLEDVSKGCVDENVVICDQNSEYRWANPIWPMVVQHFFLFVFLIIFLDALASLDFKLSVSNWLIKVSRTCSDFQKIQILQSIQSIQSRGERERLFASREREGKLKITFPFYGKGTGIRKLLREGKGREIWGL